MAGPETRRKKSEAEEGVRDSNKRKRSGELATRDTRRAKMSNIPNPNTKRVTAAAAATAAGGTRYAGASYIKQPKLSVQNQNDATTNASCTASGASCVTTTAASENGASSAVDGTTGGGTDPNDLGNVSDIGKDLQLVIKTLEKSFGAKIDQVNETLERRVSKLEDKIDGMEERLVGRDKQVEELTRKVDMIPVDVGRGVATAVAKETAGITESIAKLQERQEELEKQIENATKATSKGAQHHRSPRPVPDHTTEKSTRYWEARKCAKMSPILGTSEDDLRGSVERFIFETLMVDKQEFSMESVSFVRRVRSFGTANIDNECLVVFADVEKRDFVYSHARNLVGQPIVEGKRESNLRMHVPVHLLECFRTLDKHGHVLKQKYEKKGKKIKRHVNYDDEAESLYLDVKSLKRRSMGEGVPR